MEQGWPRVSLCSQLARPCPPWLAEVGLNIQPAVLPLDSMINTRTKAAGLAFLNWANKRDPGRAQFRAD
jgi:hypothetical protein